MNKYTKLFTALFICQVAGLVGSRFTISAIDQWYQFLNKPFFNPPNWLFGPVWTVLYLLMGIAFYLIWQEKLSWSKHKMVYLSFFIQLLLNAFWSIIFFGWQQPLWAFGEILLLWAAIVITIYYFYQYQKTAAYLLLPYLLWVSFASLLNLGIWYLN
ncbi:MAG: TspO protein [Candidatus Komeilibacteria bacterium CG_4_10_14_0_2_um_filter_37_10]|uniref:TspO protein n=1 Tax=Candidatus Komeilibacteria bacterium CG_4_10_14_0_2_um_filter_37_10 TaxID=1974470 RepID=A0A2M7VGD7_9BACT|nr:MAG: TspO protein [Candidatus Komeilibacteria bacterium CG_4_10_14_0_2_um_filter_37_10]